MSCGAPVRVAISLSSPTQQEPKNKVCRLISPIRRTAAACDNVPMMLFDLLFRPIAWLCSYVLFRFDGGRRRKALDRKTMEEFRMLKHNAKLTLDYIIYQKLEDLLERIQNQDTGVRMEAREHHPFVFRGKDLIAWMMCHTEIKKEKEALYLANVLSSIGYIYSLDHHNLKVHNDENYYCIQTPYYWVSNVNDPSDYDYAVYLCKRTADNKSDLNVYEAKYLVELKTIYCKEWLQIIRRADDELEVRKQLHDVDSQKILDYQERAFWNVYRRMPNVKSKTEFDYDKIMSFKELANWNIKNVLRTPTQNHWHVE